MEENTQPCTIEEDENDHDEEVLNMSAEIDEEKQLAALRMALTVPVLLTGGQSLRETRDNISQELGVVELERTTTNVDIPVDWPRVLDEEATSPELTSWPNLGSTTTIAECESWIKQHGKIILKTITWNLAAKLPPVQDATSQLLSPNRYHIYVIGTEECERSIAASAINPSKKQWEEYLGGALGSNYVPLRSHTLQAIHLIIFAHRCAASLCTEITSAAVATGIANTLGNKGGVAISMMIGSTKFVFANAHLAAHQNAVKRRNFEYEKLRKDLPQLLLKKETKNRAANLDGKVSPVLQGHWGITNETNAASSDQNTEQILAVVDPPSSGTVRAVPQDNSNSNPDSMLLENCADRVIFMGDLNYRIRGNRQAVDKLLESGMHDVMLANDQLKWSMNSGRVLANFTEPPLNFRPTYKFDFDSDSYDTGSKQRIPAWADRILYVKRGLKCLTYNADFDLKTSDHRPVFATFIADVDINGIAESNARVGGSVDTGEANTVPKFSSESQVCRLM